MKSLMSRLLGQDHLKKVFSSSKGRWPSACVFFGPDGVGKKQFAFAMAQNALCENPDYNEQEYPFQWACGVCGSCIRIEKRQSEFLFYAEPDGKNHKIQMSRDVIDFISLQSVDRRPRFIIIDEAHLLNSQAANALLKVVEEPPENVYFIFVTHKLESLLPTIRSRTVHFSFKPLSKLHLSELKHEVPDWAVQAARGSFSQLQQFTQELETSDGQPLRVFAANLLLDWYKSPQSFLDSGWRDEVKDRDVGLEISRFFQQLIRDAQVYQFSNSISLSFHQDQKSVLERLSQKKSQDLSDLFFQGLELEAALLANRDSVLAFEEFYLKGDFR